MSNNSGASSGIGFTGILTIVFTVLKLTKVIDWPWLWVTCPFWIPLVILLVVGVLWLLAGIITGRFKR
jgi:uncharacterized protein (DUF983 family)